MTDVAGPPTAPTLGGILADRYRLDAVLGRGGYATVYRARDQRLSRDVAVKIFAPGAADAAGTTDNARVASETRLLASVTHASLVTLFDAHLDTTPAFLVLELVDGPTLSDLIARGPLRGPDAAAVAVALAEALQVIHANGIVHRDIKPSNVLMRPGPTPGAPSRATLADFGIAALVDSARVTATGTFVGTAAYLSPEQVRGERAVPASDVYALGLVLLESLTGRRAYPQPTPHEALVARLTRAPEIPADLPAEWRALLSAMTATEPAHRPDAGAVLRAAHRVQASAGADLTRTRVLAPPTASDQPTQVFPSTPEPARAAPLRRRWPLIVGAIAVAALIVLVLVLALPSGAPAPDPTLPALPEPLGEHLRQLMEQVRP